MLPIVHHPDYQIPLRPGHRFPMSKYGYLREALVARGLMERGRYLAPAPASAAQIALAHDANYVARAFEARLEAGETRRIGLPNAPPTVRRARLAAAGTLLATWMAGEAGIALNAAGGSHHAGPEGGAGFCVFNDVAVAIRNRRAQGAPGRVLVIDCDVHQGDGTAKVFADDPAAFTLSVHAERNFPVRKARSDIDVALADGTGDAAYLEAVAEGLDRAIAAAAPALVYYNAGVDVWQGDRLGRLRLSSAGIRARDRLVISRVRGLGLPLVCVIGGGYDDDPERLAGHHSILFEEAARAAG
mgnify:CR=1 FL=1